MILIFNFCLTIIFDTILSVKLLLSMKINITLKDILYLTLCIIITFVLQNKFDKKNIKVEERLREVCFLYTKIDKNCKTDADGFGCELECIAKASNEDINYIFRK